MIIYKYEIPIQHTFEIEMPYFCKILSFQNQQEKPVIWVLGDEKSTKTKRKFILITTGNKISDCYDFDFINYIGTIQLMNGSLVYHLFDRYYDEVTLSND